LKGDNNSCTRCGETFSSQPAFMYHTPYCIHLLPSEPRYIHLTDLCN
jgi:hypothetical protein